MTESYRPEPITPQERLLDYWFSQLLAEQKRTNELLEKLTEKPKPTRKKKEGE